MRARRANGFTLIEIVMVTAIIAALMLVAGGTFEQLIPEYALRGAERSIAEQMKMAKTHAAATGYDVYIGYDVSNGRYWLWVWTVAPDGKGSYDVLFDKRLPDGVGFVDVTMGRERISKAGAAQIRVSPLGSAEHHIVNLKGEDGQKAAVKLNGLTGAVYFYDRNVDPDEVIRDD